MQDKSLLTVAEASELLRLRPSTLREWIGKRKIPHVKLGGRVFIRRSDIDALIEDSVVPAAMNPDPQNTALGTTEV